MIILDNFLEMTPHLKMSTVVAQFVDSVVWGFFPTEDLPPFVDVAKFLAHQSNLLRERLEEHKRMYPDPSKRWNIYLGPNFLMPVISGVLDPGASGILNYIESDDDFTITVPEEVWDLL